MRRVLITAAITTAFLGALFAAAVPYASAGVARPVNSGIDLTLNVGPVFAPGDTVEIHFWVTDNGSLVEPTWPAGWPHAHPPNLGEGVGMGEVQGLIPIDVPVLFGHVGAYRTTLVAPDAPGLYAIHGAATVGGVTVFNFASFIVTDAALAAIGAMSLFWSIGAFVVALITLAIVLVIAFRKW